MIIANRLNMGRGGSSGPNGAPSNLVLTVVNDTALSAAFSSASTNQDGYRVYISTDNVTFTEKTTGAASPISLTGLMAGTFYYAYVVAYKGSKESIASNTTSIYTLDANAKAFTDAAPITDSTQLNAVNNLVIDLKAINAVQANFVNFATPANSVMKAIYPFVGGSSTTHKYNLIDPRDADAAFRLTFSGGITHNANGAKPNGSDGYADTHLNPTGKLTVNDQSISFYSFTKSTVNGFDMGSYETSARTIDMTLCYVGAGIGVSARIGNSLGASLNDGGAPIVDSDGFFIGNRKASNDCALWRGHEKPIIQTGDTTKAIVNSNILLFCLNNAGTPALYSDRGSCYNHIGSSINENAMSLYVKAVQDYQTRLNRGYKYVIPMTTDTPAIGKRVKVNLGGWNAAVYHSLYLPINYNTGKTWPVIIELPGNITASTEPWRSGLPLDYFMGYGLSSGKDFIWVVAPFINTDKSAMAPTWWGDGSSPATQAVTSTQDYWDAILADLATNYHADLSKVILLGYSRGAIALNYIGCSSDVYASKWISWMGHSHWDGGTFTPTGAATRIARMLGKKCCVTYGGTTQDGGYANSQTGLGLIQAAGVYEEHYQIVNARHDMLWSIKNGDSIVDSIRTFLAQYK